jgi:phage anti-repressor protein
MNTQKFEIIPVERGKSGLEVNSRLLHKKLQSGQQYADWIKSRIEKYDFDEGVDFFINVRKSTGGRQAVDYIVTLDVAKELAMLEENNTGKSIRRWRLWELND